MSETKQSFTAPVAASAKHCMDVVADFAAYPSWSSVITATTVREHDADGRPRVVEFELDMTVKTIRYVLEYRWSLPALVEWSLVEGDLAGVEGSYRFEPDGEGTLATCAQAVDLGFWLPGPIRRIAEQKALADSVRELKAEVERRVAAR